MKTIGLAMLSVLVVAVAMAATKADTEVAQVKLDEQSESLQAVMTEVTGLEEVTEFQADYSGFGNVALLNNGAIIVRTGGEATITDDGEIIVTPVEAIMVGTKNAKEIETPLFAVLSLQDVFFDIEWGITDDAEGVITCTDANGLMVQLAFLQAAPAAGPSCSVTCSTGDCSITCSKYKACIAYCDGGTPVCTCIQKPKKAAVQQMDLQMQTAE
jgi:hypothetical protein